MIPRCRFWIPAFPPRPPAAGVSWPGGEVDGWRGWCAFWPGAVSAERFSAAA